jgi:hypothetical protein
MPTISFTRSITFSCGITAGGATRGERRVEE